MGRLRSDLVTEALRDAPVLSWLSNLGEAGGLVRDWQEEEARLSAMLLRTREALVAIRGTAFDYVLENWSEAEIRSARRGD